LSACQFLLIPDVFVSRKQYVEAGGLSDFEQLAARNFVPSAFYCLCDLVTRKHAGYAAWGALVKENAHRSKLLKGRRHALEKTSLF
jgi:hypothetical protein